MWIQSTDESKANTQTEQSLETTRHLKSEISKLRLQVSKTLGVLEFKRISSFLLILVSLMDLCSCNERDLSKFYCASITFYFGIILNWKKSCNNSTRSSHMSFTQIHHLFTFYLRPVLYHFTAVCTYLYIQTILRTIFEKVRDSMPLYP